MSGAVGLASQIVNGPSSQTGPLTCWFHPCRRLADTPRQRRFLACLPRGDRSHARRVTRYALTLFNGLQGLHKLGDSAGGMLEAAACLHDVGKTVSDKRHHKASLRLIMRSQTIPLTDEERPIVGLIARYHRASLPKNSHKHFRDLPPTTRRVVRVLSAILRLADGLDRWAASGGVLWLSCRTRADMVLLNLVCALTRKVRGSLPPRRTILFEQVFARRLVARCRSIVGAWSPVALYGASADGAAAHTVA